MSIKPTYSDLRTAGKALGAAMGFYGKSGGWIYRKSMTGKEVVVCQGWDMVARKHGVYWDTDASAYRVPAQVVAYWATQIV